MVRVSGKFLRRFLSGEEDVAEGRVEDVDGKENQKDLQATSILSANKTQEEMFIC